MALLMTILTVAAVLGGMSLLLWVCTFFESRHLGPLTVDVVEMSLSEPAAAPPAAPAAPSLSVVEAVQTAA